jgi:hypothetical protein
MFFAALVVVIAHGRHITPAPGVCSRLRPMLRRNYSGMCQVATYSAWR